MRTSEKISNPPAFCFHSTLIRVSQNFKKIDFLDIELHTAVYVPKKQPKKFHEFSGFFQEWPPLLIWQKDRPKNTKEKFEIQISTIYGENSIEN